MQFINGIINLFESTAQPMAKFTTHKYEGERNYRLIALLKQFWRARTTLLKHSKWFNCLLGLLIESTLILNQFDLHDQHVAANACDAPWKKRCKTEFHDFWECTQQTWNKNGMESTKNDNNNHRLHDDSTALCSHAIEWIHWTVGWFSVKFPLSVHFDQGFPECISCHWLWKWVSGTAQ